MNEATRIQAPAAELGASGERFFFATRSGVLSGCRLPGGLVGIDLPRAYLEPIEPAVLNDALGEVSEAYQSGPASVLAIVKDYETLCALNVDPLSLFLVPSSVVIVACAGGPDVDVSIRVFAPRLGVAHNSDDSKRINSLCLLEIFIVLDDTIRFVDEDGVFDCSGSCLRFSSEVFVKSIRWVDERVRSCNEVN